MIFDIEVIEEINNGPVYLRKVSKSDAKFFYNSLNESNLINYLSLGPLNSVDEAKRLLSNYIKYWGSYAQYNYVIELREDDITKIGSVSLWNVNWRHNRAEIGVWIIPSYWNKGYGTRAINMIKIIGFNHLKLNRLEAHIAVENQNSFQLFKKCGFKHEGVLSQYLNFRGNYHDAQILALLRKDYFKEID
ncbi:MAG: GNAT family N-acetyltransferase [Promethearchaeota archaeon]